LDPQSYFSINCPYGCLDTLACNYDVNATINNGSCIYPSSSTDEYDVCDSLLWLDGNVYTSSNNTATYALTNTVGCDSIVVLDLTILPNPTCVISQNGFSLEASVSSDYLWSTGEVTQVITPDSNGAYWCVITDVNGCVSDTSFFEVTNIVSGLNEVVNTNRNLLKVVDVFGRDVNPEKVIDKITIFYIYDDGSVEKKILIE